MVYVPVAICFGKNINMLRSFIFLTSTKQHNVSSLNDTHKKRETLTGMYMENDMCAAGDVVSCAVPPVWRHPVVLKRFHKSI